MKTRRIWLCMLSVILIVSMITGCGSDETTTTTGNDSGVIETTTEGNKDSVTTELSSDEESSEDVTTEESADDSTTEIAVEETTVDSSEDTTENAEKETTPAEKETTTKKQDETTSKKQDETTSKKQDSTTSKQEETTKQKETTTAKPVETTTKKPAETTTQKPKETTTQKPKETTTKKQEETTTKKEEETTTAGKIDIYDPPITNNYDGYYLNMDQVVEAYKTKDISKLCLNDRKVYQVVAPLIDSIKAKYATDYEREKAVHDYLVLNAAYDYDNYLKYVNKEIEELESWEFHPYGVFVNKKGVCQSYAEAFQLCMLMMDIECEIVTGTAMGSNHAWNVVKIDGAWYQVDVTFDDPVPDVAGQVIYNYFNVTDDMMKKDHAYECSHKSTSTKYHYETMLEKEYTSKDNYIVDIDKYYDYINKRVQAGDSRIEIYVTTDIETYTQYMDYTKVDISKTPLTSVTGYGFDSPDIITTNIWKMIFLIM